MENENKDLDPVQLVIGIVATALFIWGFINFFF